MTPGRWIPGYEMSGKARRLKALQTYNERPRIKAVQGVIVFQLKRKAMSAKQVGLAVGISANRAAQEIGSLLSSGAVAVVRVESKVSDKKRGRKMHAVRIYKAR